MCWELVLRTSPQWDAICCERQDAASGCMLPGGAVNSKRLLTISIGAVSAGCCWWLVS